MFARSRRAASTFYSHSIDDDLKVGALYGNFGLSLNFDDNWTERNIVTITTLMGLTLQLPWPTDRINKMWSVGAGFGINFGMFSLSRDKLLTGEEITLDDTDWTPSRAAGARQA